LDTALIELSGNMEKEGLPADVNSEDDANAIINYIKAHTSKDLKLYEYKIIDVAKYVEEIRQALKSRKSRKSYAVDPSVYSSVSSLRVKERVGVFGKDVILDGHLGTRFHKSVDIPKALSFLLAFNGLTSIEQVSDDHVDALANSFQGLLNDYNMPLYEEYDEENKIALDNIKGRLLFTRLAENGPKLGRITKR
jgi:glycogen debranching enzyme